MNKEVLCEWEESGGLAIMGDRRDLSLRLNDVLDMVGASERMRRFYRRTAKKREILKTIGSKDDFYEFVNVYYCGSSYEGTVTPDLVSDTDMIVCHSFAYVVPHRLMAGPGLSLLMVSDSCTCPGYVKLQWALNGHPLSVYTTDADRNIWDFDRKGRAIEKHFPGDNIQGPARMFVNEDGWHFLDAVDAYKCRGIPLFATEWITRHRSYGWPSQQLLDDMRIMGCMVVGAGHYSSPEKDIEWRLSFSLQERMLMKSLNPVQHKVYIILKMIKKNILEKCLKVESLSSYHCKTCVFYMAEMTPARVWTRDNLINCLIQCLQLLLRWLSNKYCPSYFIKEQNLFDKEGFLRLMGPLQWLIDLLLQTGHQFLYMLQSDRVGEMLSGGDMRLYRHVADVNVNERAFFIKRQHIWSLTAGYYSILKASKSKQNVLSFFMCQHDAFQYDRVPGYTAEESKAALRHLQPWLHLYIGMEIAVRAVTCTNRSDSKWLMKKADLHFHLARNTDLVNTRLAQASILFRSEKFEECFLVLEEIERSLTLLVMTLCRCRDRAPTVPVRGANELFDRYPPMRDMSLTQLMRNHITTCVIILPSQTELVPPPLWYEMVRSLGAVPGSRNYKDFWFDWAVVDAKVYLYFMQYLVCSKLDREPQKQIAVDNLASFIQYAVDEYLHHKETAYNLLGWIYLQEHRVADAVQCFLQSWKLRPHHNAAKFHMRNVCTRLAEVHT